MTAADRAHRSAAGEAQAPANLPIGGTTDLSHEHSVAVDEAARWLATSSRAERCRPTVPLLRERFGLSVGQACAAIREARLIQARSL